MNAARNHSVFAGLLVLLFLVGTPLLVPGVQAEETAAAAADTGNAEAAGGGGFAEKIVLGILGICSVLVVLVLVHKLVSWNKTSSNAKELQKSLEPVVKSGDLENLTSACASSQAPLAKVLSPILAIEKTLRPDQVLLLLRNKLKREGELLKKHLMILATLAGTAPFIGLFGTVLGILETFSAIGESGFSNPAAISVGISQALVATAAGLAVAIPAVILYNYYVRKANGAVDEAEHEATEILILFGRM